jgi:hypothetical protein
VHPRGCHRRDDRWGLPTKRRTRRRELRSGEASTEPRLAGTAANWQAAARLQIAQEQRAATAEAALAVISQLPEFPRAERLLDLGGGNILLICAGLFKIIESLFDLYELTQVVKQ